MPLQKQVAAIPLKGLDTKSDPKNAAPGSLALIENMHFRQSAQAGAGLQKRYGGTSLSKNLVGGGALTVGRKLARFNGERLTLSDTALNSWSPEQSAWVPKGPIGRCSVEAVPVASGQTSYANPDMAIGGGLLCSVYTGQTPGTLTGDARVTIVDATTGATVLPDTSLGVTAAADPSFVVARVVALSSCFMVFAQSNEGSGHVVARKIAFSAPTTIGAPSNVVTDAVTSAAGAQNFDVTKNGANDSVMFAYSSTAANKLQVLVWDVSMAVTAGPVGNADVPNQSIAWLTWDFSDGNGYLAYCGSSATTKLLTVRQSAFGITATTTLSAGVTSARNLVGFRVGTTNNVFATITSGGFDSILKWNGSTAFVAYQRAVMLWSRIWKVGSNYFCAGIYSNLTNTGTIEPRYFIFDFTAATPVIVASALLGSAQIGISGVSYMASVPAFDATTWAVPATRLTAIFSAGGSAQFAIAVEYLRLSMSGSDLGPPRKAGEVLLVPGGVVRQYDGANLVEAGFHLFPEPPTLAQSAGGTLTALAVYSYIACYEWADARGQVHRSAFSAPATVTLTGSNQTITYSATMNRTSDRLQFASGMQVVVYRTVGNGTTYYRRSVQANNQAADLTSPIADTLADASLNSSAIAYTDGGALPHIPLPPAKFVEMVRNRPFLAGTESPTELWVLNEISDGEGISGSDALVISMQADGGGFAGLAEMNDRLIIFRQRGDIFALSGDGPALNGSGQFLQPQRIASASGAIQTPGIVRYRDGVAFKCSRGIYALTGGGQVVYIGAAVEGYNALNVTGACVVEDLEQVRFTTDSGRTLVYHYGMPDPATGIGLWSTYTGQAAVDCIDWAGTFVYLASDGTVTEEVPGQYNDNGTAIAALIQTTWLNLAQMFGRFRLYGVHLIIGVLAGFDLVTTLLSRTYGQTTTQTDTNTVSGALQPPLIVLPVQERLEALQMTISEVSATQGFTISALGLEVGIKPGAEKAPAGQFLS